MSKKNKTAKSVMYGRSRLLTQDEEIRFAQQVHSGKKFLDIDDEYLKDHEIKLKKEAIYAANRIVEAYAPLIEKIAREQYSDVQSSSYSYDDFLSEAFIIAIQCARGFDPFKGRKIIRFSSYVSRPVSSALQRMNYRTKTPLYTPNDKIAKARKWSHPFFDMQNKGIEVDDSIISKISGVNMKQSEVSEILDSTASQSLDDITHPSTVDKIDFNYGENQKEKIIEAFKEVFPEDHKIILEAIGVTGNKAIFSSFLLSNNEKGISREYAQKILDSIPTIMSHPIFRFRIQSHIM